MPELSRALTRTNAIAMVAGTIIGASIFVQPSEIARYLDTPAAIMLVWLVCGVLTCFGALVCAELASAFPQTGGVYVFLRETFSPLAGFLWGWAMFWSMHSGIVALIAIIFARHADYFLRTGDTGIRVLAVLVVAVLSVLNYTGVRAGSRVQTALTVAKLAAIAVVVITGLVMAASGMALRSAGPSIPGTMNAGASDFLLAVVAGLTAYGGWHMVTYTAGETIMPARTIPVALFVGVATATICYMALNLVYLIVLPLDAVRTSTRVAADAADAVLGRGGSTVMAVLVMMSSLGALTGIVLTGPRVYYSMARDGLAFRWLDHVHPVYRTPSHAILAQGIWASFLAGTGEYRQLFTRVIYTEWLFFAALAAGLFALRRRADYAPQFRTWGYPAVPMIFMAAALAIVVNQVLRAPADAAIGLGIVAAGAPIYYLRHARR